MIVDIYVPKFISFTSSGLYALFWLRYYSQAWLTINYSFLLIFVIIISVIFGFLGPHPWHMEVPRLGVQLELQLLAYTTATEMWDLSLIFDLHQSSRQRRSLTHWARPGIQPASSWILFGFINHWASKGTPNKMYSLLVFHSLGHFPSFSQWIKKTNPHWAKTAAVSCLPACPLP